MAAGTFSNKEFPAGKEKQEHTSSENRVESGGNFNGLLIQQYVECCRIYNRLKATAAVSYSQEYLKAFHELASHTNEIEWFGKNGK